MGNLRDWRDTGVLLLEFPVELGELVLLFAVEVSNG
jgi:hypothetical protein